MRQVFARFIDRTDGDVSVDISLGGNTYHHRIVDKDEAAILKMIYTAGKQGGLRQLRDFLNLRGEL